MHLLVLLTLIPSVGLPVFGWSFVSDRHALANSAGRVAQGLRQVGQIDQLRVAMNSEMTVELLRGGLSLSTLTPAARALIPRSMLPTAGSSAAATDAALAPIARQGLTWVPGGTASLSTVKADLISARQAASQAAASGSFANFSRSVLSNSPYFTAFAEIQQLEQTAFDTIAGGGLGISTPELLASTAQAQAVSSAVLQGSLLSQLFFVAEFAPTADRQVLTELATATATFDSLAERLAPRLSSELEKSWQQLLANAQIRSFRVQVAEFIAAAQRGRYRRLTVNASTIGPLTDTIAAAITFGSSLSPLLAKAVTEGIDLAREAESAAASRARTGAVLALAVMLTTLAMLVLVGGLIRYRLAALATAAQRLSSGTLVPMPVHWPREVAIASQGLNDAVTNLNEITTKAALIARGDIASPVLERPSPGPLGAAMHASFESVVTMVRDLETLRRELAHQASHDALTGLANRAEAERLLTQAVTAARHDQAAVGLFFIDLDRFKAINDTYGHAAGDHVLCSVSRRLVETLGDLAVACRLGGDEFLAIFPRIAGSTQLTDVATRITESLGGLIFYQDRTFEVGASIGISHWTGDQVSASRSAGTDAEIAEQMLVEADDEMYRTKAASRTSTIN